MPRFSKRVRYIRRLRELMSRRLNYRAFRMAIDDDEDSIEDAKDEALQSMIKHCESQALSFPWKQIPEGQV